MENTEGNGGPQADFVGERELFTHYIFSVVFIKLRKFFAHCLLIAELIKLRKFFTHCLSKEEFIKLRKFLMDDRNMQVFDDLFGGMR